MFGVRNWLVPYHFVRFQRLLGTALDDLGGCGRSPGVLRCPASATSLMLGLNGGGATGCLFALQMSDRMEALRLIASHLTGSPASLDQLGAYPAAPSSARAD